MVAGFPTTFSSTWITSRCHSLLRNNDMLSDLTYLAFYMFSHDLSLIAATPIRTLTVGSRAGARFSLMPFRTTVRSEATGGRTSSIYP